MNGWDFESPGKHISLSRHRRRTGEHEACNQATWSRLYFPAAAAVNLCKVIIVLFEQVDKSSQEKQRYRRCSTTRLRSRMEVMSSSQQRCCGTEWKSKRRASLLRRSAVAVITKRSSVNQEFCKDVMQRSRGLGQTGRMRLLKSAWAYWKGRGCLSWPPVPHGINAQVTIR